MDIDRSHIRMYWVREFYDDEKLSGAALDSAARGGSDKEFL
jgi:hypothetical protein